MRFSTAILAAMTALCVAVIAAAAGVLATTTARAARSSVEVEVRRAAEVFSDLSEYRGSLYRAYAQVVSQEPRLKALVNTREIDHATVIDSARELQGGVGCDLLVLTDSAGRLRADTADPTAEGFDLTGLPAVAEALASGEASAIWVDSARAYQVQARGLRFADETVGALVLGFAIDGRVAATVSRETGAEVMITMGPTTIAASSMTQIPGGEAAASAALTGLPTLTTPTTVRIEGAEILVISGVLPGSSPEQALRFFVLRSLDEALAASREGIARLLALAAVALLAAIGLALALARRLSAPLEALVGFTRALAGGDLKARALAQGPTELASLASAMNSMASELEAARGAMQAKQRLHDELEIAEKIQTSITPKEPLAPGLEIAAAMIPASEVGGDYYDVLPVDGGCWLGIGDVAGHGLKAGLVMMMVQSCVSGLIRATPHAGPGAVVASLNGAIYENVRERLRQDEHVTLTLIRLNSDGTGVFAGAHEPMLIARAKSGAIEAVETPGTWIGVLPSLEGGLPESSLSLERGDVLVLYTDGLIEARDAKGVELGRERVEAALAGCRERGAGAIRDALIGLWRGWVVRQEDDVSVVVVRFLGAGGG